MKTQRIILNAFSIFAAIFGCAGVTATNQTEYLIVMLLGMLGVLIANLEYND